MSYLDQTNILAELVEFLRNEDMLTITQRGVTTTAVTGTFSAAATFVIAVANIKNVRSVVVGGLTLTPYTDYTVKTKITFTESQTGAYTITYDAGADRIFNDYPKSEMKISNFPRVAVEILDIPSEAGGFGNVTKNDINFTVVVYDTNKTVIRDALYNIKKSFGDNWTSFYYLNTVIRPTGTGPLLNTEDTNDKVFQQNQDFKCYFKYESN